MSDDVQMLNVETLTPNKDGSVKVRDLPLRTYLRRYSPHTRKKFLNFLKSVKLGLGLRKAMMQNSLTWSVVHNHIVNNREFRRVYFACKDRGDEARQIWREDIADKRAFSGIKRKKRVKKTNADGETETTVTSDAIHSDRLAEIQLKANNPAKYADKSTITHVSTRIPSDSYIIDITPDCIVHKLDDTPNLSNDNAQ